MIIDTVLKRLVVIASEKEWPKRKLTPDEIYNILISPTPKKDEYKPSKKEKSQPSKKRILKYDKIDFALVEIKRLNAQRYVNVITARKIERTEKKLSKFWFDDRLKLCCPKEYENSWTEAVEYYQSIIKDSESEEFSDNFDWATDEYEDNSEDSCWDYITDEVNTPKNIVKSFFS